MGSYRQIPFRAGLPRHQAGTNLIEVMVALVILSIGLLGLALMQLQGLRHNTDAYLRTQATFLASEIIERMRANAASAADYTATPPTSKPSPDCITAQCTTGAQVAASDLWYWSQALGDGTTGLPQVQASISSAGGTQYVITLKWREQITQKDQSSSSKKERNQHVGQTVTQTWSVDL